MATTTTDLAALSALLAEVCPGAGYHEARVLWYGLVAGLVHEAHVEGRRAECRALADEYSAAHQRLTPRKLRRRALEMGEPA